MLNRRLIRPSIWMTGTCASSSFAVIVLRSSSIMPSVARPPRLDALAQRLVGLRLEVLERELLELVLDLAHPEPVGDRRVDVARLLRDLDPALLGQVVQRPHVVEPIRELDQDDADVVDHRQQHLAEVLRLALFARRELDRAELGHALDDVRDVDAEQLPDPLDRRLRVLDDVVQQARRRSRRRRASCRRAGRRPRADGRGRARRSAGPAPCARRPRTRRRASAARCRRPGLLARTFSTRSSNRIMKVGV